MPKNPYFLEREIEDIELYEDLIIETIQIYGHDVYYLPADIVNTDTIFNDVKNNEFLSSHEIEVYVENIDSYEGEGQLLGKFGIELRSQMRLVMTKKRWNELVGEFNEDTHPFRPNEGDLIYFPLTKGLFVVRFVDGTQPFYQLGNIPVFKLTVELFDYSNQASKIETGVDAIDNMRIIGANGINLKITYDEPEMSFEIGEKVLFELPTGIEGEMTILRKDDDSYLLSAPIFNDTEFHWIVAGTSVSNEGGTTTGIITTVDGKLESANDRSAQNTVIQKKADDWIDFSESNPFGDSRV